MRGTYKAPMKLWQNDDTEVPGYWFPAPEGAETLEGWSPFRSRRVWLPGEPNHELGEQVAGPFVYDGPGNPVGYNGLQFCGPQEAFRNGGEHGNTPDIITDDVGSAPCCDIVPEPPPTPFYVGCQNIQPGGATSSIFYLGLNTAGRSAWIVWSQTRPAPFGVQSIPGYDLIHTATTFVNVFGADQYVTMSLYYRELDGTESDPTTFTLLAGTTGGGSVIVFEDPSQLENAGVGAATDITFPTTDLPSPSISAGPNAQVITHAMRDANSITFEVRDFPNPICPYSTNLVPYKGYLNITEQTPEALTPVLTEQIVCAAGFGCSATYAIGGIPD